MLKVLSSAGATFEGASKKPVNKSFADIRIVIYTAFTQPDFKNLRNLKESENR